VCISFVVGAIALRFCIGGWQTIRGERSDLIWAAATSLLLGLLLMGSVIYHVRSAKWLGHVIFGAPAALLISAGLLASYGRGAYLRWQRAEKPASEPTDDANMG
jgi:hypothetical protein